MVGPDDGDVKASVPCSEVDGSSSRVIGGITDAGITGFAFGVVSASRVPSPGAESTKLMSLFPSSLSN